MFATQLADTAPHAFPVFLGKLDLLNHAILAAFFDEFLVLELNCLDSSPRKSNRFCR